MIIIVFGVAGAGKTTIGKLLADRLGWSFFEADDYHSQASIQKMKNAEPLGDRDRLPWIAMLARLIHDLTARGQSAVLACSALKRAYRRQLAQGATEEERVKFVYLKISRPEAERRLRQRREHYMPASMVPSQFKDLEEPEDGITLDGMQDPSALVDQIIGLIRR
jgi:gluconokinase